jgi:hypothetical protein
VNAGGTPRLAFQLAEHDGEMLRIVERRRVDVDVAFRRSAWQS